MNVNSCVPVILAGGFGKRIKKLLPNKPKPMAEVYSKPFISWIVEFLINQGFSKIVISTGYKGHLIDLYFKQNIFPNISITCIQENSPLGTAGGFLNAINKLDYKANSWLILNGDSLILSNIKLFVNKMREQNSPAGVFGLYMKDASRYGSLSYTKEKNLISFCEKKSGSSIINAGVYFFKNKILSSFPKKNFLSFETDVFPKLLEKNISVKVFEDDAPFIDIGIPSAFLNASKFIEKNFHKI